MYSVIILTISCTIHIHVYTCTCHIHVYTCTDSTSTTDAYDNNTLIIINQCLLLRLKSKVETDSDSDSSIPVIRGITNWLLSSKLSTPPTSSSLSCEVVPRINGESDGLSVSCLFWD